jgi:UDP-N-acetylmuramyl tripeptide synthase
MSVEAPVEREDPPRVEGLPARARLAVAAGRVAGAMSRAAGRGSGAVVGGRLALRVDPLLLRRLAAGLEVVLVSGTNGKTTTTRLVAEALRAAGAVASNALGANMPAGITASLAGRAGDRFAVLEVDEKYLPMVAAQTAPKAIALLNLSRDQLDRAAETRMLAQRWRDGLAGVDATLVANADDPLVVWAAGAGAGGEPPTGRVVWVGAGTAWREDAWSCPACGGVLDWPEGADGGWACGSCAFHRPRPRWHLAGSQVVDASDGSGHEIVLALPGRANRANATTATAVASLFGVTPAQALPRLAAVTAVAGRYVAVDFRGRRMRLLLAKNPAGWQETFDLLPAAEPGAPPPPVLLAVNALDADGTDTSWLWDVDYTRLAGRRVLVTGQRRLDLAVRLQVAGVDFGVYPGVAEAVDAAPPGQIEAIANYTAFQQLRRAVGA